MVSSKRLFTHNLVREAAKQGGLALACRSGGPRFKSHYRQISFFWRMVSDGSVDGLTILQREIMQWSCKERLLLYLSIWIDSKSIILLAKIPKLSQIWLSSSVAYMIRCRKSNFRIWPKIRTVNVKNGMSLTFLMFTVLRTFRSKHMFRHQISVMFTGLIWSSFLSHLN